MIIRIENNKAILRGFEVARAAARYSNAPKVARKVGAALFSNSTLLSIGFNRWGKTHPDARGTSWNIHAEHSALIKRQYHPKKVNLTMYVYRELFDGTPACSRPCENCLFLLREGGIRLVRFIDRNGTYSELRI